MEKKQTRTASKSPAKAKAKLKLNKITVRDLETQKADEIKGGSQSIRQRCF